MRFQPKTEDEISAENLLIGGEYPFEVIEAAEQTSKSGNDMVKLRLSVLGDDERKYGIFDYLVGTDGAQFKVRHFAASVGLLPDYDRGELRADSLTGRTGRCQVGIQKQSGYPDKNIIRDYLAGGVPKTANGAPPHTERNPPPIQDDDIPF